MAIYFFAMYLLGGVLGPLVPGLLSARIARQLAAADGVDAPTALHKAIGLHDALYLVPALDVVLVLVVVLNFDRDRNGDLAGCVDRRAASSPSRFTSQSTTSLTPA